MKKSIAKLVSFILVAVIVFSMAACGKKEPPASNETAKEEPAANEAAKEKLSRKSPQQKSLPKRSLLPRRALPALIWDSSIIPSRPLKSSVNPWALRLRNPCSWISTLI